jgi:hypothetical protein
MIGSGVGGGRPWRGLVWFNRPVDGRRRIFIHGRPRPDRLGGVVARHCRLLAHRLRVEAGNAQFRLVDDAIRPGRIDPSLGVVVERWIGSRRAT